MIVGIGVDIAEVSRVRGAPQKTPQRWKRSFAWSGGGSASAGRLFAQCERGGPAVPLAMVVAGT
jgi:phosphopantetheinyl transferase (holo-ACP synthase)